MIRQFHLSGYGDVVLYKNVSRYNQNIFSILVGRNGTGKSRLLGEITGSFIKEIKQARSSGINLLKNDFSPSRIIAVSTSPFDKFQLYRDRYNIYSYLGIRDLRGTDFSVEYLSKIIASLIESITSDTSKAEEIFRVLKYLDYKDHIEINFQFPTSNYLLREIRETDFEKLIHKTSPFFGKRFNASFFYNKDGSLSVTKEIKLKKILDSHYDFFNREKTNRISKDTFTVTISSKGIELTHGNEDELLFLIMGGILRLRDVVLFSIKDRSKFSIKTASSGEQSIILSLLGIASKIKDNSLICIDEPEICLHPQWQEKYIELLTQTFSYYKNCHFIIATHSPQIISCLPHKNSYIVDMESGSTKSARHFVNHSADYQLVNIFESPGYKNEYLSRLAFTIFSKVSETKTFDKVDLDNYRILIRSKGSLDTKDPVHSLIITLTKLFEIYGRH